jgi:hypothetical protein
LVPGLTQPASRQHLEARKGRYRLPDEPARFGKQYLLGTFPVGNLSAAAPVGGGLPFRVTVSARSEFKQFFNESDANIDRLTFSGRIQYVDPTNDQVWSPYFGITPPLSYLSTFSDGKEVRQDFNLACRKAGFDNSFQLIPGTADTSAETVWSLGLTAFGQNRQSSAAALVRGSGPDSIRLMGDLEELEREPPRRIPGPLV